MPAARLPLHRPASGPLNCSSTPAARLPAPQTHLKALSLKVNATACSGDFLPPRLTALTLGGCGLGTSWMGALPACRGLRALELDRLYREDLGAGVQMGAGEDDEQPLSGFDAFCDAVGQVQRAPGRAGPQQLDA
jgi:hypothetical protein